MSTSSTKQTPSAANTPFPSSKPSSIPTEQKTTISTANFSKTASTMTAVSRTSTPLPCKPASCSSFPMESKCWNNQIPTSSNRSKQTSTKDPSSRSSKKSFSTFRRPSSRISRILQGQGAQAKKQVEQVISNYRRSRRVQRHNTRPMLSRLQTVKIQILTKFNISNSSTSLKEVWTKPCKTKTQRLNGKRNRFCKARSQTRPLARCHYKRWRAETKKYPSWIICRRVLSK